MICADTSTLIAFFEGEHGEDILALQKSLVAGQVVIAPVTISELLSSPLLSKDKIQLLGMVPVLPLTEGYWSRVGLTRAKLVEKGLKCNLADSLIAQSCMDNNVPLISRDKDFRHFAKHCGLKLAV